MHAHLNGSIREHTLVELAAERNVSLPPKILIHELKHHDADKEALLFNNKPRSLKDCFDIFAVIPHCVNDLEVCFLCYILLQLNHKICSHHYHVHIIYFIGTETNHKGGIR